MSIAGVSGLERRLKAEIAGDVFFDTFSRGRYATDASHYQMMPLGVIVPRTVKSLPTVTPLSRPMLTLLALAD
jgi:hypothetical protein